MIVPEYLFHIMESTIFLQMSTESTRPSLMQAVFNKMIIALTDKSKQTDTVGMLVQFHELTMSLSSGIIAEIEARSMQYEY